jgi:tetratricopeptide (TPR) repeat protein
MAKRIIIISSFPVCIILVVLAIVFVLHLSSGQAQQPNIESATSQILSLVKEGKIIEADAATDNLLTNYSNDPDLPAEISVIADTYCWNRKLDNAERLYNYTITNPFDNTWQTKARLNTARIDILKLIDQKKFSQAKEQLDFMVKDFGDEPNLPVALFHIGQEFGWQRRYDESKAAFNYLTTDFSNTSLGQEAKLWSDRINICSLINGQKASDTDIATAIDKLISDYKDDSRLIDTLFWLSREYEWTKGASNNRTDWYNTPNSIYDRLVSQFKYGQAEWDYKRLSYRMKIFNLMKGTDQNAVDSTIEQMVTEFTGRPELAGELYWIACGYEEYLDKGPQAIQIYERIIKECPDSVESDNATLDIRRRIIWETIYTDEINTAEVLLDKFIADFKDNPYAGVCLGRIIYGCYKRAFELKGENQTGKAQQYNEICAAVWEKITDNNLQIGTENIFLYFYAACNYHQLQSWDKAIETYQKILDIRPDFKYGCGIQAAIGYCYEKIRDSNEVPKEAINPIIEDAYKAVLENYAGCMASKSIAIRLGDMMLEKGDKTNAIVYYRKFLELADPNSSGYALSNVNCSAKVQDGRIAGVKAKIAELEGFVERFDEKLTAEGGVGK